MVGAGKRGVGMDGLVVKSIVLGVILRIVFWV
jgi:hypothetical protein